MKTDVIEILKNEELSPNQKFNALLKLFLAHPSHGRSQARFYNMKAYTPETLSGLTYDVKKLFRVKDVELVASKVPVPAKKTKKEQLLELDLTDKTPEEKAAIVIFYEELSGLDKMVKTPLPDFKKGKEGTKEMKSWLTEREVTFTATTKKDLAIIITDYLETSGKVMVEQAFNNLVELQTNLAADALEAKEAAAAAQKDGDSDIDVQALDDHLFAAEEAVIDTAPDDVKAGVKFRKEFPFLSDEDCPMELKVLVADKITAYENFMAAREEIKDLITAGKEDLLFEAAAAAVENFELNLEIYNELNYYAEHKEILGEHPIFEDLMLQRKVDSYKTVDLVKKRNNLRSGVSQEKGKLKKLAKGADTSGIDTIIAEKEKEIALIQARIDANA